MPTDGQRLNYSGLTEQQRRALDARGTSVAVSAGAGCGKTFVLTERFLAELKPDGPHSRDRRSRLGQVAAITFTERAAREMRERIRAACNRRLRECPDDQADYWMELVRELDSARISTIHSFCASLLRAHAVEARLDPRFRVLDGAQAGTLLFELTDDALRDRLADRQETVLTLVARFGLDRLRDMIARLLAVRQEIDWPVWRNESDESLVARWAEYLRCDTLPRLLQRLGTSVAARTLLELASRRPSDHPKMQDRFEALIDLLSTLTKPRPAVAPSVGAAVKLPPPRIRGGSTTATPTLSVAQQGATSACGFARDALDAGDIMSELATIRQAAMVQGAGKKHWVDEDAYERFKDAAKTLREAVDGVLERMSFDTAAARPAAEAALQAIGLAADVAEQYERRKRELAVLDFNDLLIHARRLLVGPEQGGLRKRLASQIRLLLVDEFQDTDPLQVELVKALCDNEHLRGKLFLVGDYKQSIYRFRGADPRVFGRLREEFSAAGRLPLSLNFRSQPAVLDFVNALFAEELGPEYEPLRAARPQVGPAPAVEFLWACDAPTEDDSGNDSTSFLDDMGPRERLRRREAEWIARRIRAMLDSGEKIVWDEEAARAGTPVVRAVRPGDVALLFRAMTNAEYYEDALQRYGIDYYLVGGRAFYAQQEIYDLLNLLRTLDGRCDEVSLAGALRSPLFSLHDETLFWLARHREGLAAGLFEGELPAELDADQREQAEFAAATIRDLRALKDRLPVARLIQAVLDRTGYDAVLLAEFLGERKLANLHKLIEQARSFDHSGVFALSDFITQLAEFVARQPDEPLAATCPESTDVVKLMSIHQSKGLEFPVVIVPDVGRSRRIMGPPVAFTPQLGPMLKDPDATTGYDLFMAAENDEDAAEHSRLLYVAATRAADYLILSSGVERPGEAAGPWMELIARRFDLLTGQQRGRGDSEVRGQRSEVRGQRSEVNNTDTPNPESRTPNPEPLVTVTTEPPPIQSKPVDLRLRRDLEKIVEKAGQMAADGAGRQPRYLAPPEVDRTSRRQFSFSRLSGELHAGANVPAADRLDETASPEPQLDPRGLGTLVHAVLAQIDFARPEDVQELVERLAPEHLPAEGLDLGEPIEMIGRFLRSPRAAELAVAEEIYRELEFMLAWPCETASGYQAFHEDASGSRGGRYLQGFIDCIYRDDAGRWRLIDFKTNQVTAENPASVAAVYEMQMLLYALAAENILRSPPAELALCFLRPGIEHRFSWDSDARRRMIELVDGKLS